MPERLGHIDFIGTLKTEFTVWKRERNNLEAKVNWHFRTKDARVELVSLYPEH